MPEKKAKNYNSNRTRQSIFVLAVLISIAVVAVVYSRAFVIVSPYVSLKVPLIQTTMLDANGEEQVVQTKFGVTVERKDRSSVNHQELSDTLSEIMAGLDYERVAAGNGVSYINQRATEELNRSLNLNTHVDVYITDIAHGTQIQLPDDSGGHVGGFMRRVFGNLD